MAPRAACLLLVLAGALPVHAAPGVAAMATETAPATLAGHATLRFLGLKIYEATLHVDARFDAAAYDRWPLQLELTYARTLEGRLIAERSLIEMRRIAPISAEQARRWMVLMETAFPDVHGGERLSGTHDGHGTVRFFFNGEPRAQIVDAQFARLFFGIWLHPATSQPALRRALLGAFG